ncbi:MAG: hypothetical protein ACLQVJ_21795 [Syntrophobacteraceae bacterium]
MRIPKRNFFSQSLLLLIFSGFLFSSYTLAWPGSETGGNTPSGKELPGRQASYAQYAALIAGIRTPQSILEPFESRPAWTEFAKSFDHNWEKYEKMQLAPMRKWAASELAESMSSGLTVFYPFSGPDFINPYTLFPGAGTYILIALEPIGGIPGFQAMSRNEFDSFFADIRKSLHDLLNVDYFISAHMHTGMESKELNGVLPFLLFVMAREKTRILDVEYWFMEPDGTIQKVPGFESGQPGPAGAIPGVRIVFESAGSPGNKPQTLYYFRLNLYNFSFRRNRHFITFLQSFGPLITFMKSASYVMFDPKASIARQFVLDQSRYVLQEDSGIPVRYFDPSVWALQFYGTYSEPKSIFKDYYQADLAKIYETGRDIKPLPFGIGYHFQVDTANLLFATRK